MDQFAGRECTPKCRSAQHAQQLLDCIPKGSSSEIRSYCKWLCYNFSSVTDKLGRNILHVAASCGKWEIVEWLLDHCHAEVDIRDAESGWTALHRSLYYGYLSAARILLSHGANYHAVDRDGLTPLDLIVKDRLPYIEYINSPAEVYVWGSNSNYNLGLENQQSRSQPEVLEFFRRDDTSIRQVVMCKFHSAFLSSDGRVYTCGHGFGGRLGQNSEETVLTPSLVRGLGLLRCEQVAAGQDHLVLLLEGGQVWTCGLNTYHQLGHSPPPEKLLIPKPVSLKFLKGKEVIGVCAARYHSVFYTRDSVFTFGLNAGQLGHPKGPRTQITPHQVSGLYNEKWKISHVTASDGATVCATTSGDVYVLHEYQQRRIASKQLEIKKLSAVGGNLDSTCQAAGLRDGGALELRVLLLTKSGKLFLWRQSNPFLRRCLFTCPKQILVLDVNLSHYTAQILTHDNEGYSGIIMEKKGAVTSVPVVKQQSNHLSELLDKADCEIIKMKRIPHVYRGISVASDSKGRNFAVLQANTKMGLLELPAFPISCFAKDMAKLLEETNEDDNLHDVVIKVGQNEYFAHKYILAAHSEYFKKHLINTDNNSPGKMNMKIENIKPEAFEQVLKFLYCNTCDFLVNGYEIKWGKENKSPDKEKVDDLNTYILSKNKQKKKKSSQKNSASNEKSPFQLMQEASRRMGVPELTTLLEQVMVVNKRVKTELNRNPRPMFSHHNLPNLSDVTLCSSDGKKFQCHKCILVARSDYFQSMLGSCWIENTRLNSLTLPIPAEILDVLLLYLYNDAVDNTLAFKDVEFVCQLLAVADQLLLTHLKELCEGILVCSLTLRNATELLQFSSVYNAVQLKKACMEYICINLCAIIEGRTLDVLSYEMMEELSIFYRELVPSMRRRVITPGVSSPSKKELQALEKHFPVSKNCDFEKAAVEVLGVKNQESKSKSRRRTLSHKSETKEPVKSEEISSEADSIVLEISVSSENKLKNVETPKEVTGKETANNNNIKISSPLIDKKPGQWILSPIVNKMPCLEEIMMEEKRELTVLQKSPSGCHEKRIFHVSQKQKKLLAAASKDAKSSIDIPVTSYSSHQVAKSPPSCPWAKTVPQSPPSESFWDTLAKGEFHSTIDLSSSPTTSSLQSTPSSPVPGSSIISLEAIQREEEEELNKYAACKPKAKSLDLINIEDQAIEELLLLYKADANPNERVTVSRILPEKSFSPRWKTH